MAAVSCLLLRCMLQLYVLRCACYVVAFCALPLSVTSALARLASETHASPSLRGNRFRPPSPPLLEPTAVGGTPGPAVGRLWAVWKAGMLFDRPPAAPPRLGSGCGSVGIVGHSWTRQPLGPCALRRFDLRRQGTVPCSSAAVIARHFLRSMLRRACSSKGAKASERRRTAGKSRRSSHDAVCSGHNVAQ